MRSNILEYSTNTATPASLQFKELGNVPSNIR